MCWSDKGGLGKYWHIRLERRAVHTALQVRSELLYRVDSCRQITTKDCRLVSITQVITVTKVSQSVSGIGKKLFSLKKISSTGNRTPVSRA